MSGAAAPGLSPKGDTAAHEKETAGSWREADGSNRRGGSRGDWKKDHRAGGSR